MGCGLVPISLTHSCPRCWSNTAIRDLKPPHQNPTLAGRRLGEVHGAGMRLVTRSRPPTASACGGGASVSRVGLPALTRISHRPKRYVTRGREGEATTVGGNRSGVG